MKKPLPSHILMCLFYATVTLQAITRTAAAPPLHPPPTALGRRLRLFFPALALRHRPLRWAVPSARLASYLPRFGRLQSLTALLRFPRSRSVELYSALTVPRCRCRSARLLCSHPRLRRRCSLRRRARSRSFVASFAARCRRRSPPLPARSFATSQLSPLLAPLRSRLRFARTAA